MKQEFEIVREFTHKLGLENQTDGSLFIYNTKNEELRERERETNGEEARWILLF